MKKYIYILLFSILSFNVFAQREDENDNPELLKNEFFHEVSGNAPTNWTVHGATSEVFNSGPVFNSSSGYALRVITSSTPGYVEQVVSVSEAQVAVGQDVEGLIHYAVDETANEKGALRLMMQWLDDANNVLTSEEDKKFVDNESLLFSKFKAWGTLWFRTTKPSGATKFRFAIKVEANSNVRFDDFSLKKQDSRAAFISVLPQELRSFEANVGKSQSQKVFVQIRNFVNDGSVTMPTDQPFTVDKTAFDNNNGTKDLTITFSPTKPIKIPRGLNSAPSVTVGLTGSATVKLQLKAMSIDPNNPPTVSVEPAVFPMMKLAVGETLTQEVLVKVKNVIDEVKIKVDPMGKGFAINTSSLFYFSKPTGDKKEGVNDTKIKVTFRATAPGKVEAKLVFTSDLMTPVEYKITANVAAFSENIEERFSKEKEVRDVRYPAWAEGEYHFMDTGLWHWPKEVATYGGPDYPSVTLTKNGTTLTYTGGFVPGQIYNQSFPHGIKQVTVYSAGNGNKCKLGLDVSYDGGGSWTRFETKEAKGAAITPFKVDSHKNTMFRIVLVNDEGVAMDEGYAVIEKVKVVVNSKEDREDVANEKQLVNYNDKVAVARLFTEFNDIPHHLNLVVDGWSNYAINTNRPFVSFDEHESDINSPLVESCAKVTLYKSTRFDETKPMKSVLMSPLLSYNDAASKQLGFRLKRTIVSEGDKFYIYILKLKNGVIEKEDDMVEIPYEKILPQNKMAEGFWYDYLIDLEKFKLNGIDKFAVMFMLESNNNPENTTTSYFIDDFSWGRTDNPKLSVDNSEVKFYNMSNQESEPQKIAVSTKNAVAPVVLKLFGHEDSFLLYNKEMTKTTTLPKDGGELFVTVKTQATKDIQSILYMATRNGAPLYVTLFATQKNKESDKDKEDNSGNNNGVDKDGYDLGDDIINGKTSIDGIDKFDSYAYRSAGGLVVVSQNISSVTVYDTNGNKIKEVRQGGDKVVVDNINTSGVVIVKIVYNNGDVKTVKVL